MKVRKYGGRLGRVVNYCKVHVKRVRAPLAAAGKSAVIPPRPNRLNPPQLNRELYKARHLIENFFCKLKQFRAIATRYDKTAGSCWPAPRA